MARQPLYNPRHRRSDKEQIKRNASIWRLVDEYKYTRQKIIKNYAFSKREVDTVRKDMREFGTYDPKEIRRLRNLRGRTCFLLDHEDLIVDFVKREPWSFADEIRDYGKCYTFPMVPSTVIG
jgi:hypothetical protein